MKLRNGLIFLMILVLTAAWLPASADSTDFPFLPGMNWESTVPEMEQAVGTAAESDSQDIGNSGKMVYFKVKDPGLAPAPYELGITLTADNVISMAIFLYDISSASDKDAVRGQITDETEKLYEDRGEVMFDSPEGMKQAFAGKTNTSDTILATALGGLEGATKDMYTDMDEIVRTKSWLVNREFSVMVAYSTEGTRKDVVAVVLVNISKTLAMMMDASLPTGRIGYFDLPAGLGWACSRDALTSVLSSAGYSYEFNNNMCQVTGMNGPTGNAMPAMYMFQGDELMGVIYIPSMSYANLEQIMTQEYGNKAAVDTESIKKQAEQLLGTPATQAGVWLTADTMCYLFECNMTGVVMQISVEMLMAQQ